MTTFEGFGERPRLENRRRVVKMAWIYTPLMLLSIALMLVALVEIVQGRTGFLFMFFVFGVLAFLTGFQAIGFLKDLKSEPIEYQGSVVRKWHKGNLLIFFMPSFYMAVDSRILHGRVTRVGEDGCYVRMENGREGFVPRKEVWCESGQSPQEAVHPGDEIRYKVIGVDRQGGYRLSHRRAEDEEFVTKLFTVNRVEYAMLLEQDTIRVTCYPHSNTVERIDRYDDIEKKFVPATEGAET